MQFVVYALDKPGTGSLRATHRDAHRGRLENHEYPLRIIFAGPLLGDEDRVIGSLFLIESDTVENVRAFVGTDPYWIAGVYESVAVHPFRAVIGSVGGGET